MESTNCWDYMRCGLEEGGSNSLKQGVCPAAELTKADGINGGKNGGRACWGIERTLCEACRLQPLPDKLNACIECDFYMSVVADEGASFANTKRILQVLD